MKPKRDSKRNPVGKPGQGAAANVHEMKSFLPLVPREWFSLAFGVFLGLAFLKFGNPVILESKITSPQGQSELWSLAWPPGWAHWIFIPLACWAGLLVWNSRIRWPHSRWLWILPLSWFGWQLIAAARSVDHDLTTETLWQFTGCLAGYFAGALVIQTERRYRWLLVGLLAGFAICSIQAVNQKLVEFPSEGRFLVENERTGWTNVPPQTLFELKQQGFVISTNGIDVTNPIILKKYQSGRVFGTLVYPNALAGAALLLFPISVALAIGGTRRFRGVTRWSTILLTIFLGGGALVFSGSKSGWLIALVLLGLWLFRLNWPGRLKWIVLAVILFVGLGAFGLRFRTYFAKGATSVGARFDYWQAAGKIALGNPLVGSGPGTFQRPYAQIKSRDSEMARLVHNDYLEQFSDSGFPGGLTYAAWIVGLLSTLAIAVWRHRKPLVFATFLGVLGWFVQGVSEFGLYIPALAWTAFTLAGCLLSMTAFQFDKPVGAD